MSSPTLEQSGYLSTLEDGANMLQKAQTNLKKCPKQRLTEGYIKARLKSIDEYWDTLKQAHDNLTRCTPREQRRAIPYFLNEEYFIYEELYLNIKADLTDLLSNFEKHKIGEQVSMNIVHDDNQSPFAKLPRIQLPIFSGKYEDWPTYQDLFVALVHNTSISDVQKLHYLKTSVSGDAELLLRQIPVIGSNYKQTWEILKGRFGNKKIILNSILKRLFNQKKIVNQCASQIKALLDTTTECINSLNNLKISTDSWDPIIIFLVGQKLDTESLKDWEYQTYNENHEELPTWTDLKKFLESKFRTLELITPTSTIVRERPTSHRLHHVTAKKDELNILNATHASMNSQLSCTYCNDEHYIFNCKDFVAQPVEQRHEFVKRNHLCYNCLIPNHNVYRCKQKKTCRVCRRRHHSLLHKGSTEKHGERSQPEQNVTTLHFSNEQPGHEVLLATAQVEVKSRNGETHILRALIDQGSEASFVSARVVELLGLTRTNINGVVSGVGEGNHIPIKHVVDLTVSSRFNKDEVLSVRAYILKSISAKLPSKHVTMNCNQLEMLPLADPTFYKPSKIDILLGTDVFCQIIEDGLVKLPEGIVAQKTRLG